MTTTKTYKKLSLLAGFVIVVGLIATVLGAIEWRDSGQANQLTIIGVAVIAVGAFGMFGVVIVEWYNRD